MTGKATGKNYGMVKNGDLVTMKTEDVAFETTVLRATQETLRMFA